MEASGERVSELESELHRLPGVLSARVLTDELGAVRELHVVADESKAPKQIVRDVSTLAIAQFGVQLDHRVISVVRVPSEAPSPVLDVPPPVDLRWNRGTPVEAAPRPAGRVRLESVATAHAGSRFNAEVVLGAEGRQIPGRAEGQDNPASRLRVVARAALGSLATAHPELGEAAVDVAMLQAGEPARSMISVLVVVGDGEEMLTGAAMVGEPGPEVAAARALLDATNRHKSVAVADLSRAPRLLD